MVMPGTGQDKKKICVGLYPMGRNAPVILSRHSRIAIFIKARLFIKKII